MHPFVSTPRVEILDRPNRDALPFDERRERHTTPWTALDPPPNWLTPRGRGNPGREDELSFARPGRGASSPRRWGGDRGIREPTGPHGPPRITDVPWERPVVGTNSSRCELACILVECVPASGLFQSGANAWRCHRSPWNGRDTRPGEREPDSPRHLPCGSSTPFQAGVSRHVARHRESFAGFQAGSLGASVPRWGIRPIGRIGHFRRGGSPSHIHNPSITLGKTTGWMPIPRLRFPSEARWLRARRARFRGA